MAMRKRKMTEEAATSAALADRYGEIKELVKSLDEELKSLRAKILKVNTPLLEGEAFCVSVTEQTRALVDLEAMRKEFPELVKRFTSSSTSKVLRHTKR
jgi:hypothetical protein